MILVLMSATLGKASLVNSGSGSYGDAKYIHPDDFILDCGGLQYKPLWKQHSDILKINALLICREELILGGSERCQNIIVLCLQCNRFADQVSSTLLHDPELDT